MTRYLVIALIALHAIAAPQLPLRVEPRDDAKDDIEFDRFREALRPIAKACDGMALVTLMADDVRGPEHTSGRFEVWEYFFKLSDPHDPEGLCPELTRGLNLGAWKRGREYCVPHAWCLLSAEHSELFGRGLAAGPDVPVRAGANATAKVLDRLTHEVVTMCDWVEDPEVCNGLFSVHGWRKLITPRGAVGYVRSADIFMPGSTGFWFGKRDGQWYIVRLEGTGD